MSIINIPRKGDIIKFKKDINLMINGNDAVLVKNTLAEVIEIAIERPSGTMFAGIKYILYLASRWETPPNRFVFFEINYNLHQDNIEILPNTPATKVLFSERKK